MPTLPDLLLYAQLSNLAYEVDVDALQQGANKLGAGFVALVSNGPGGQDQGDGQVVIVTVGNRQILVWRGTQVSEHFNADEIWDDIDPARSHLWNDAGASTGFWDPMVALMPGVLRLLNLARPIEIIGHSKGGAHAVLSRAFFPKTVAVPVITFGQPAPGDASFYKEAYGNASAAGLTRVVAESDFAPDWGRWDHPAGKFLWLHDDQAEFVTDRPGLNLSVRDHSIDGSYVPKLAALAKAHPTLNLVP